MQKYNLFNRNAISKALPNQTCTPKLMSGLALLVTAASALMLSGCDKDSPIEVETPTEATAQSAESAVHSKDTQSAVVEAQSSRVQDQVSTRNKPLAIDWSLIDSGQKPVAAANFNYPFELDGDSVKSQAKFSNITPEQARHSLTVGMASNEPLEKILDQLGNSYLSHDFSETEAKLRIYTTPNVEPSQHNYVISHEFARGLTLPIEIVPQTKDDNSSSTSSANN